MIAPEYGAAFIGLLVGGMYAVDLKTWPDLTDTESYSLYGMTILQATSYFRYASDPLWMKFCIHLCYVHFSDKCHDVFLPHQPLWEH